MQPTPCPVCHRDVAPGRTADGKTTCTDCSGEDRMIYRDSQGRRCGFCARCGVDTPIDTPCKNHPEAKVLTFPDDEEA